MFLFTFLKEVKEIKTVKKRKQQVLKEQKKIIEGNLNLSKVRT